MIDWEGKLDTNKTWANLKTYFKYIYAKQKRYKKVLGKKYRFESSDNIREMHIISKDIIPDMFG